jgi:integrase
MAFLARASHVHAKGLRAAGSIERMLRLFLLPRWGRRPIAGIRRVDLAELLDHIEDKHGARQSNIVLTVARSICNFHAARDDHYVPPFVRGMKRSEAPPRGRILNDGELRAVWRTAEGNGSFGAFVMMLLLTGQRRDKVVTMRWDDMLTMSGTSARCPREGQCRHSAAARGRAAHPRPAAAHGGKPVRLSRPRRGPIAGFAERKDAFDAKCGVADWILHHLRRTSRSLMSRAYVRPEVTERVLGHALRGVVKIYDRHEYRDQKGEALAKLAALIASITGENVVPLARPR